MKTKKQLKKLYKSVYKAIQLDVRPFVTADMIFGAIAYHKKMVKDYSNRDVIYFLGEENTTDVEFVLQKIARVSFWRYCGSWIDAIHKLLKDEVPRPLCKFLIDNKQGGAIEISIIRRKQMECSEWSVETEIRSILDTFTEEMYQDTIEQIKQIYITDGFENEISMIKYILKRKKSR